ncbi:helix-turn-helix domain-containing protein [Streptomyces sp. NPDC053720]|uniref:TetR/AcrR family transcriptional regulator n=1 Tax=Streptomyces sp. NPDC053720 TaxID=3154855 RepID=UPI003425AF46
MNATVELAERDGAAGLSMRKLAQELDPDVTVLYRLFRDKDELLLALCERTIELALDEIGEVPGAEPWQDTARRVAEATWQVQNRLPATTALTGRRGDPGRGRTRRDELAASGTAGAVQQGPSVRTGPRARRGPASSPAPRQWW